jgi:hypothetical protein
MSHLELGQIVIQRSLTSACKKCGAVLPHDIGQTFEDCEEWGLQTLSKTPPPYPLTYMLQIQMHTNLCKIMARINDEVAMMEEGVGGELKLLDWYRNKYGYPADYPFDDEPGPSKRSVEKA